jgi:hypothetical protein
MKNLEGAAPATSSIEKAESVTPSTAEPAVAAATE